MFVDVGRKLRIWAKIICWIGILLSVLSGILCIRADDDYILIGIIIIIAGVAASWVTSLVLYGFGEIVDNTYDSAKAKQTVDDIYGVVRKLSASLEEKKE